jgi:alkaline phosphatase
MIRNVHERARLALAAVLLVAAGAALAAPTEVSVVPPSGARFIPGQRFDLRVEGKGTGPYSATVKVNGKQVAFTSGDQGTSTTDGITSAGYGGFNVRGYSLWKPGLYVLEASFTDATGTATAASTIEIVGVGKEGRSGRFPHQGFDRSQVKNVILFIGDGMGVAHRTAARLVRHGVTAGDPNGWLAMDRMPGTGLLTTHSLNSIITDSAPGMSCYTTGNHQNNNQEGVFPAKVANPFFAPRVEYLGAYLHRVKGTSLGIVSTADIEDATPAANAVYTAARGNGTGICDQYLDESGNSGLRVLMGGGRRWFLPSTDSLSSRTTSTDYPALPADLVAAWGLDAPGAIDAGRDLVADFGAAGFAYADSSASLDSITAGGAHKLLGLFAYGNMNTALDKIAARRGVSSTVVDDHRAPHQPMLDEMTRAAIEVLKRGRKGFVLMVEGAHIDKQSHAMDADRAIGETIELDRAIEVGLDFAAKDGETLVLVTADHECSGFSLIGALSGGISSLRSLPSDTAVLDPATQPARQKVVGTYESARFPLYAIAPDGYPETYDVDGKMLVGYGASGDRHEDWLTNQKPIIEGLTPKAISDDLKARGYASSPVEQSDERGSGYFLRGQAAGRSSAVHTASDVPISAYARDPQVWQRFVGVQRNTDVFFEIAGAVLGGRD